MKIISRSASTILLLIATTSTTADTLSLPLQLDYTLIKKVVTQQLYTGNESSVQVWHDPHECSHVILSNPEINGQNGQIRLLNHIAAKLGTYFGGQCVPLVQWSGLLETLQQPTINNNGTVLSLPVTQVTAYDQQGRQLNIAKLQDLLKNVAATKLTSMSIDLLKYRQDIEKTLLRFVPKASANQLKTTIESLKFNKVEATDNGVNLQLGLTTPTTTFPSPTATPLTAEELKQSQALLQEWQRFLTKTITQASKDCQSQELRDNLKGILANSQKAFKAGLDHNNHDTDPVRIFFTDTWERLAPLLKELANELPEAKSLQYLTFIAGTDIMYQLDKLGAPYGLSISSDGLRNLVRELIDKKQKKNAPQ